MTSIAIIGMGPRGTSVLERLAARGLGSAPVDIHLVDDSQFGAGRVWRTDQDRELCMNTLAGAVTLFTDPGFGGSGPLAEGPTLFEWCRQLAPELLAGRGFDDELRTMRPESHPSRALYGEYLVWCLARARATLGPQARIVEHHTRAVAVRRTDGGVTVDLADGTSIEADDVVLALGWVDAQPSPADVGLGAEVAGAGLTWVEPESPIRQDLDGISGGDVVIARGLGMGFFDSMALLTIGRGGRFEPGADGLVYHPSGGEPRVHVGSRRGVPFRAKSLWGGLPPSVSQAHLTGHDWAAEPRPINFDRSVWPLIVADADQNYRAAWARLHPDEAPPPLDLPSLMDPAAGTYNSPRAFDAFVQRYLADDLREAAKGQDSPLKMYLWSFSVARRFASKLGSFDGMDAQSHSGGLGRFMAFGQMIGSGPPAFRNEQLLALARAGIVSFIGPHTHIEVAGGRFVAESPSVSGSRVEATILLDAWMRSHDARSTADPLVKSLLDQGLARPHARTGRDGGRVANRAVDVDPVTTGLIHADGTIDDAVQVIGIPVDEARGDTIISPMPRTDPTMLRETDAAAEAAWLRIGGERK